MGAEHTILIVDDEEPIRKAIRKVLKYEPYTVLDTGDPAEAVELAVGKPVHLVVSDHRMPGMSGTDLLRTIKLRKPEIIRIMLTGYADLEMALKTVNEGGIYRFLTKPWDNTELLLAVRLGLRAFELEDENRRLVRLVKKHWDVLNQLENSQPGITGLTKRSDGGLVLGDDDIQAALDALGGSLD